MLEASLEIEEHVDRADGRLEVALRGCVEVGKQHRGNVQCFGCVGEVRDPLGPEQRKQEAVLELVRHPVQRRPLRVDRVDIVVELCGPQSKWRSIARDIPIAWGRGKWIIF